MPVRLYLLALILAVPAIGQESKLPDGVRLRLGADRFREVSRIQAVALSPDGKRIAVANSGQVVRILDVATGAELRRIGLSEGLWTPQLLFIPDGKQFVTRGYKGVHLWDAENGRLTSSLRNEVLTGGLAWIHLSPDGKKVVIGSQRENEGVKVFDLHSNAVLATLKTIHNVDVQSVVSPDGQLLAVWGRTTSPGIRDELVVNRTVQLFDLKTGAEKARFVSDDPPAIGAVRFSPDGSKLALGGFGIVQLWDVASAKLERRLATRTERDGPGKLLVFSPDGKLLSAAGEDGAVQTWETATGKRVATCEGPSRNVVGLHYRPDNQLVAWAVRSHALDIWEVPSGNRLTPTGGHAAPVAAMVFGPDDKTLVTAGQDGQILRWDAATGKELGPFRIQGRDGSRPVPPQFGAVLFSPDGKFLLANGSDSSTPAVWNTLTGDRQFGLDPTLPRVITAPDGNVAFAADSSRMSVVPRKSSLDEFPIAVWDLPSGRALPTLNDQRGAPSASGFSPNGTILATAAITYSPQHGIGTEVWAWDVAAGKPHSKVFLPGPGGVGSVVFLDHRLYVPFIQNSQEQKVYDALTGQEARTLEGAFTPAAAAALSPDGRLLAATTQPYSVKLHPSGVHVVRTRVLVYEAVTGSVRHEFRDLPGDATSVTFSRDGKTLAVGCSDTTILLFDLTGPPVKAGPLSAKDLDELWAALDGSSAKKAEPAMRKLAAQPSEAVPFLAGAVKPAAATAVTAEALAKLIADLDAPRFAVREAASQKLERLGTPARPAVTEALKRTDLTPEMKERLEKVKVKLDQPVNMDEWVRPLRVVEVLERIGSAEAVAHLKALAGGGDAPSTRAARAALGRLNR